jgi:hypothetical protein
MIALARRPGSQTVQAGAASHETEIEELRAAPQGHGLVAVEGQARVLVQPGDDSLETYCVAGGDFAQGLVAGAIDACSTKWIPAVRR